MVQILVRVATTMVKSHWAEVGKGYCATLIAAMLAGPKDVAERPSFELVAVASVAAHSCLKGKRAKIPVRPICLLERRRKRRQRHDEEP